MKKIWFRRKWYGWGWYPATWEGWLVLLLWLCVVIKIFSHIDQDSHSVSDTLRPFLFRLILAMIVLIGICMWKGEKPKWQWGPPKEK